MITNITLFDLNNKPETYKYHQYFDKFKDMTPWLHINTDEWKWILENIEEDIIKESLTVVLSSYEFPYKRLNLDDVKEDFFKLKDLDTTKLTTTEKWFSRSNINKELSDLVLSGTNIGNKASDFYQQEFRMDTELENSPSQVRVWKTPKFMRTLINGIFTLKKVDITETSIRSVLAMRKGVASQFKPSIAKWLYDTYKSENILDFSAGWGDRLCGFYTSNYGKNFLGIDPNPNVHIGYKKQIELYSSLCKDKKAKTIVSTAEDIDLCNYKEKFDTVFTSPPYFNREQYTEDETQSWVRYKTIDSWLENFLFKTIENIEPVIKKNGILAINISDVYSTSKGKKKGWLEICNPLIEYVESLNKFKLESIVGYKISKKPNLISAGTGITSNGVDVERFNESMSFAEPIFIWRKLD